MFCFRLRMNDVQEIDKNNEPHLNEKKKLKINGLYSFFHLRNSLTKT